MSYRESDPSTSVSLLERSIEWWASTECWNIFFLSECHEYRVWRVLKLRSTGVWLYTLVTAFILLYCSSWYAWLYWLLVNFWKLGYYIFHLPIPSTLLDILLILDTLLSYEWIIERVRDKVEWIWVRVRQTWVQFSLCYLLVYDLK